MKFYNITLHITKFLSALAVLTSGLTFAQKGTQNPYSVFGIGELNQGQYAAFHSMGGISIANSDSTIASNFNPANYAYVQRYRPIFQVGMSGRVSQFSTASGSTRQQYLGLNQFQLALPVKKNWGLSFGLVPYSFTGYTITKYGISDDDTVSQAVDEGSGAISKVFFGVGYKPLNFSKLDTSYSKKDTTYTVRTHILAFGANGNYLFGSSSKIQSFEFFTGGGLYNSRVTRDLRLSDLAADFGLNYQYYFRPAYDENKINGSVSIAATYAPGFKLRAFSDLYSHNYLGSYYGGQSYVLDTVEYVRDQKGSVFIPDQYRLGFEYRIGWKPSKKGERLLRIGTEVNIQNWSAYYENFGSTVTTDYYKNRMAVGVGIEYCPVIGNDPSINILARTNYRIGFNYTQTELSINGTDLNDYGMTFGFGLPVNINSTNTSINLGASLGNMGTTDNGLINEKYLGFYFGLSIIPDRNELWFVKRKYD